MKIGHLEGIIDIVKQMKAARYEIFYRRLLRLQSAFEDCQDAKLLQSFKVLLRNWS